MKKEKNDNVKFFEENKYVVIPKALTGPILPVFMSM